MLKSLNELTNEDLTTLRDCAALFFLPWEIAMMLGVGAGDFEAAISYEKESAVYNAYWGGKLQAEVDLRTSISKMAKAGSTPAQSMMLELLKLSKLKMVGK